VRTHRREAPDLRAVSRIVSSRLVITLWLAAVTPTRVPCFTSSQTIWAPVNVLPAPADPGWRARCYQVAWQGGRQIEPRFLHSLARKGYARSNAAHGRAAVHGLRSSPGGKVEKRRALTHTMRTCASVKQLLAKLPKASNAHLSSHVDGPISHTTISSSGVLRMRVRHYVGMKHWTTWRIKGPAIGMMAWLFCAQGSSAFAQEAGNSSANDSTTGLTTNIPDLYRIATNQPLTAGIDFSYRF
jgi:hypothetical protein